MPTLPPHSAVKSGGWAPWLCPPGRVSQDAQQAPSKSPLLIYWGHLAEGTPHNTTLFLTSAIGGRPDGQRWACLHTRVGGETGLLGDSHVWTASYTTGGLPPSQTWTRGPQRGSLPARAERCLSGLIGVRQQTTTGLRTDTHKQMEEQGKTTGPTWPFHHTASEQRDRLISKSFQQRLCQD